MKSHLKLKKLNTKGLGHHALIAVLVISGVAGFGAWRVYSSSAATNYAGMCGTGYALKTKIEMSYLANGTSETGKGEVRVFTKGTGTNTDWCAYSIRTGISWGLRGKTKIEMSRPLSDGYATDLRSDSGDYLYYAGPIRLANAKKINIYGSLDTKNKAGAWIPVRIPYNVQITN